MTLPWIVLITYILTSIVFITYLMTRKSFLVSLSRLLYVCCTVLHLLVIVLAWHKIHHLPLTSPPQAMNMIIFLASLVFMPLVWRRSTIVLGAFFLPVATCILAFLLPSQSLLLSSAIGSYRYLYPLHTLSVVIGEALFVVAFVTSLVYLIHERIIMRGSLHTPISGLPALMLLDKILYASLSLGFIAITVGMIFGGLWATALEIQIGSIAPKVTAGGVMWAVFALSLHQRFAIGWKGSRTAIITLIGFCLMLVLFFGIRWAYPHAHGIGLL